jgi:hypothetical protein
MAHAIVTVTSTSALLMHAFPLVPIEALDKKPVAEQAELAAYRDPDSGQLYVPGINIQRALVAAAAFSKGKGRASLQKQVAACVLVTPERVLLGAKDYVIDSRPVVIAATKGRIVRHRPRLDSWKLTFTVEWDATLLTPQQVRHVIDDMGTRVGLLDFRPERKGPFGRCVVTSWEEGESKG